MNDKQFKTLSLLLVAIFILLFIIFFGHIFTFISSIFIGIIGFIALVGLFVSTLKPSDFISFAVVTFFLGIIYAIVKYEERKEREKQAKKDAIDNFISNDLQDSLDSINSKESIKNPTKLIETLRHGSCLESSDSRVALSLCALGSIYSTDTYGVYDINKAINFFIDATNKGNKYAEITLGKLYFEGKKVKANYELAWDHFYKVRKIYPSEANLYLGLILRKCHKSFLKVDSTVSPNTSDYELVNSYLNKSINTENPLPLASFKLGVMTYLGQGTEKNYDLAYSLMYNAVSTCLESEVIYLSEMYFYGIGVEKDYGRALYYAIMANRFESDCQEFIDEITIVASDIEKANAYYDVAYSTSDDKEFCSEYLNISKILGSSSAIIQIASHHIEGTNLCYEVNETKAYELLLPLALNGNAIAQYMISDLFINGKGIEKDRSKGLDFLKLAAGQNHANANAMLAFHLQEENNNIINERVFNTYLKAAELGNAYSCYVVGDIYINGIDVKGSRKEFDFAKKNISEAIRLLENGASAGNTDCQLQLGTVYYYGAESIKNDYALSFYYFNQSYSNGEAYASKYLGLHYDLGLGIKINHKKAIAFYQIFLENYKDSIVFHNLGHAYIDGLGVESDVSTALAYYEKGARLGLKASILALAHIYIEEKRVEKDLIKSLTWFYVAAELNFNEAYEEMKSIKDELSSEGIEKSKNDSIEIASEIKKLTSFTNEVISA